MKKKLILFLTGIFLISFTNGQSWEWLNPKPSSNIPYSICFPDQNTGYIAGDYGMIAKTTDGGATWFMQNSGTSWELESVYFTDAYTGYAAGVHGTIIKTTDGGATWVSLNSGTTAWLHSVHFADVNTGYVVGENASLKTNDGGQTWQSFVLPYGNASLYSVWCTDANTCYILGDGAVQKTSNGGATWTYTLVGGSDNFYAITFADVNTGFIAGDNGSIYKTNNAGSTWLPKNSGSSSELKSVYFLDSNIGYAVGGYTSAITIKTVDGGLNWTTVQEDSTYNMNNGVFITSATTAFVVGYDINSRKPFLLKTVDAGATFNNHITGTTSGLNAVTFPLPNTGFTAGDSGTILRTTDSGFSWEKITSGTTHSLYSLSFPSPGTGYVAGSSGTVLKTTNNGNSWTNVSPGLPYTFSSVDFIDDINGCIVGQCGIILKTSDGGTNWNTIVAADVHKNLYGISFAGNVGFAVGSYTDNWGNYYEIILKTTDGGTTWVNQSSGSSQWLHSVQTLDSNTAYAAGESGTILKTTNGGTTWQQLSSPTTANLCSVFFRNPDEGYVIGNTGQANEGAICLLTINGGMTWSLQNSFCSGLSQVYITDDNKGFCTGSNGTILGTGDIAVGFNSKLHASKAVMHLYPNPASSELYIEIASENKNIVSQIKVFSLDGKEVLQESISSFKGVINLSSLQNSIYFIKLINKEGVFNGKFVKE
ncbi:MAG: YCF48-related protein [Bacteroidetes bacterium]|nr:YCF48-related protein [Bacteroidota bacterium]